MCPERRTTRNFVFVSARKGDYEREFGEGDEAGGIRIFDSAVGNMF